MNRKTSLRTTLVTLTVMLAASPELYAQSGGMNEMATEMPSINRQQAGLFAESPSDIAENPYVLIPVIDAYHQNEKVWFIHTEVSDSNMAKMLTNMVGYATVHSPELSQVDPGTVGTIYVFTNGVSRKDVAPWGGGPFHYQIDVLDSVPGDDDYTPLRNPRMVSWNRDAAPRILRSEEDILAAERAGELTIQRTDVIVNVPIVHPHPAP